MKKGSEILKSVVGFELGMLILSLFSFAFIIGSLDIASAPSEALVPTSITKVAAEKSSSYITSNSFTAEVWVDEGIKKTVTVAKGEVVTSTEAGVGRVVTEEGETLLLEGEKFTDNVVAAPKPTGKGLISRTLGLPAGSGLDALASGLQWAGIAYLAGMLIGGLFGMSETNTKALSTGLAGGFGIYKTLSTYNFEGGGWFGKYKWLGKYSGWIGLGVGVTIFITMYKKTDVEVVTFDCKSWQAPTGGNDCEICNDDVLPCSEYRCKALGQSCEIVNKGTADEKCVYVNPRDVVPPVVRPWLEVLSSGHNYVNVFVFGGHHT